MAHAAESNHGSGGPLGTGLAVVSARERFETRVPWLDSKHCFSFGHHYSPDNTHHGLLIVSNDDVVAPGTGFDTHPHRDMEIVTWVLEGSLVHQDSEGHSGVIYPGLAQRMSAGRGILHSEKNDSWRLSGEEHRDPVHFVQMWVLPGEHGIDPGYEQLDVQDLLVPNRMVVVASGMARHRDERAISIAQPDAAFHVARMTHRGEVTLPDGPFLHVFVARGRVELEGAGVLEQGDSVRISGEGGQRIVAMDESEILVWEMHSALGAA